MKDATFYILSEVYRILTGASLGVNVYAVEKLPSANDKLFVRLSSSFYLDGRSKDKYQQLLYVNVDVVWKYPDTQLTEKDVAQLSNKVVNALIPGVNSSPFNDNADFNIYDIRNTAGTPLEARDATGVVLIRQLEFEFKILIK